MQPRPISPNHLILHDQLLGKGSTGNVYRGLNAHNPSQKTAIKEIDMHNIDNEVTKYLLSCQITALSQLSKLKCPGHDHVVKLIEVVPKGHHIYLVMQLLEGGTLSQYLKKYSNGLPQQEALELLKQIVEGHIHISQKNIIHRDLKPDNILFQNLSNNKKHLAIIDFGYCDMEEVKNKPQMFYNVGSPKYMSPEAYRACEYSEKSDIWAIGAIFYQMLSGHSCDQGYTMEAYLQMLENKGLPLPSQASSFSKHLLKGMMAFSPSNRFTGSDVLRQIINYFRSKQQNIQQNIQKSELREKTKTKNNCNPVFQSVLVAPRTTPQKYPTMNEISMNVRQTAKKIAKDQSIQSRVDRALVRSRSSNLTPLHIIFNTRPSAQSPTAKIHKTKDKNQDEVSKTIKMEYYAQQNNQKRTSPKHFVSGNITPRQRINFNFMNQPASPLRQTSDQHSTYFQELRIVRNNTQLRRNDENSIKINIKNNISTHNHSTPQQLDILEVQKYSKESPLTISPRQFQNKNMGISKLVGGFTLEQIRHSLQSQVIRRRDRVAVMPQMACRQQHRDLFMRQASLPKKDIYQ